MVSEMESQHADGQEELLLELKSKNTTRSIKDFSPEGIIECARRFREPVHVVRRPAGYKPGLGLGGRMVTGDGCENITSAAPKSVADVEAACTR